MHYGIVLAVAFVVTLGATPLVRSVAVRVGAVKAPGRERDVHTRPLPDIGGVAMFLGFLCAFGVASQLGQFREVFADNSEPLGVLLGAGVMVLVGLLDDLIDVSPPAKLAGMVLAAGVMARFGLTMFYFRVPFNLGHLDVVVLSADLAPIVTVGWVVLMANAINLIDGLDGLASGIVMIAGAAFYLFARELFFNGYLDGANIAPLVSIVAIGICAGFLPWNWHPASIIMGDCGALFLGLLMAVPTITVGGRTDVQFFGNAYFFFAPLLIPIVILGVPVADTVFSFFRRVLAGKGFAHADRGHLHHRLMEMGHGPRRSVAILWAWTALLSGAALLPIYTDKGGAILPFVAGALLLSLYIVFHPGVRTSRARRGLRRHPSNPPTDPESDGATVVEMRRRSS